MLLAVAFDIGPATPLGPAARAAEPPAPAPGAEVAPVAPVARVAPAATHDASTGGADAHEADGAHDPTDHEHAEGLALRPAAEEPPPAGAACAAGAPVRGFDVAALAVDITLNRYLDHDPEGQMYALADDVDRVRDEEAANAAARVDGTPPAVSIGLQGDAIQPLVLRAHPGDCVHIELRNDLDEPATLSIHGAGVEIPGSGPAIDGNPDATAAPGATVTYEWQIPADEPAGTHYFHSHADRRFQSDHGLFGALVVEPPGATWTDPRTGEEAITGWDAIVLPPDGAAFREFVVLYHEVGDESYQPTRADGSFLPLVDPLTDAYRPGGRALNYRSEPFLDRLELGQSSTEVLDESLAYSSYAYGDPATPIMRTELGDPTVQRIVHGGSEVFHVHHVHGGATRWRRQPATGELGPTGGLDKAPPVLPGPSERTDSQSLGPSEVFDVVAECGAGGCQQSAGDFLFHCHIAHHYFAGMWGIWRVYNTRQDGAASTDGMAPLLPLPDRTDDLEPAVPSHALAADVVGPQGTEAFVAAQLPPPGVPRGYDASVWDWTFDGDTALGEADDTAVWPGYASPAPGRRNPILFDPRTGRPAFPFLRPHLARRPPFAPGHGPAPFLDPAPGPAGPSPPGASGPASVCPEGTHVRELPINAISLPITQNAETNTVDPHGLLYVLRSQEEQVRADPSMQVPLAVRANAGEDCVDVLLRNEISDADADAFSKIGLHIHFTQFDVQGSDGLDTGFNYEQTIRPFREAGTPITTPAAAGATAIDVTDSSAFSVGAVVGIGLDQDGTMESRRIVSVEPARLTVEPPLEHDHGAGEIVSSEFVRYRWYPDAQFGTAYFHDHVDAIHRWRHGLFGALIAEPPGSTYHDPRTGLPLESGPIADIHTDGEVSADVTGSFRELALFIQDDNPFSSVGRDSGSAYNLRVEPLDAREGDPALVFSSDEHGDPATPILEANLGDPVVLRALVGATNDVHTLHVDGHWFRHEPFSESSVPVNTVHVGISERFDLVLPRAGGPQQRAGDYLYYSGEAASLREGSWGLVRVHDAGEGDLQPLPGHEDVPASATTSVCPEGAPVRHVDVTAADVALPMLGGDLGRVFVEDADLEAVRSGTAAPEPLVLHVTVGDCLEVRLTNATDDSSVSFHCDLLAADPATSGGVAAGREPAQAVAPEGSSTFTYYASPEVGPTVSLVRDFGDVLTNPALGLYGAVIVAPAGSTITGRGPQVVVDPPDGDPYRDVALFLQDGDDQIGTHRMPYTTVVRGTAAINYAFAPDVRRGEGPPATDGDPGTPVVEAFVGDPVQLHVLVPSSEQVQVFGVDGHTWAVEPAMAGSRVVSSQAIGGLEAVTLDLRGGAGGVAGQVGDFRFGAERGPFFEAGMWGVLRVLPADAPAVGIEPLSRAEDGPPIAPIGGGVLLAAAVAGAVLRTRRRRSP